MESKKEVHLESAAGSTKDSGIPAKPSLDASEFAREAAAALARIEQGIIDAEIDADAGFVSDGVLEVEFEDGGKMIVNRHDVSRQVWVAGRTGAYHFRWDGQGWVDTRSGQSLLAVVSGLASEMAGKRVVLR
jgi:CyaY protein